MRREIIEIGQSPMGKALRVRDVNMRGSDNVGRGAFAIFFFLNDFALGFSDFIDNPVCFPMWSG
jgi:hypothetical protein